MRDLPSQPVSGELNVVTARAMHPGSEPGPSGDRRPASSPKAITPQVWHIPRDRFCALYIMHGLATLIPRPGQKVELGQHLNEHHKGGNMIHCPVSCRASFPSCRPCPFPSTGTLTRLSMPDRATLPPRAPSPPYSQTPSHVSSSRSRPPRVYQRRCFHSTLCPTRQVCLPAWARGRPVRLWTHPKEVINSPDL